MDAAALIDGLAAGPLLVFGSLPPAGRDLDVAARTRAEADALAAALVAQGWTRKGRELAWFGERTARGVEAASVEDWGVGAAEADALFGEALPVEGYARLLRPAPHHVLLLLARQAAYGSRLSDGRRARLDAAVAEDPGAWDEAARRAPQWGAAAALEVLRGAASSTTRVRAVAELQRAKGVDPARALLRGARAAARSRDSTRGAVVALSGLDGSGKSTQAAALRDALNSLGVDAEVEWTKIARNPSIARVAQSVKRVLRVVARRGTAAPTAVSGPGAVVDDPARALRQRSGLLTFGWTMYVSVTNAYWQRRATKRHLAAGRVVVCDRYVLDSAAHLRYRYGDQRRYPLQTAVIRLLSPKPLKAWFLDVSPEAAFARKQEQYNVEHLARLRKLYHETLPRVGVERIDGEQPVDELAAWLAREVWLAL